LIESEKIDSTIKKVVEELKSSAPHAVGEAKQLVQSFLEMNIEKYKDYTVHKIAELRISTEGQEGTSAFLEKRKPKWRE
jgi:methylglutaconyl-CoA hydratase